MDPSTSINDMLYKSNFWPNSRASSPSRPTSPSPSSPTQPRQIDWPQIHELVWGTLQPNAATPNTQPLILVPSASALVKSEVARCNINGGYVPDHGVYNAAYVRQPNWHRILCNLYWKVFRQALIWDVFRHLLKKDLVNEECLTIPMDLIGSTKQTHAVTTFLCCFELISELCNESFAGRVPLQSSGWYSDVEWLATVIVRSGAPIAHIREALVSIEIVGDMNTKAFAGWEKRQPNFQVQQDPRDREGKLGADGQVPPHANVFGFWLPHGLSSDHDKRADEINARVAGAERIVEAYNDTMSFDLTIPILALTIDVDDEDIASPA